MCFALALLAAGAGCEDGRAAGVDGALGALPPTPPATMLATSLSPSEWGTSYRWVGFYLLPSGSSTDIFANRCPQPAESSYKNYITAKPLFDYAALRAKYLAILGNTKPNYVYVTNTILGLGAADRFAWDKPQNGLYCVYEYDDARDPRTPDYDAIFATLPANGNGTPASGWLFPDVMSITAQTGACDGLSPQSLSDAVTEELYDFALNRSGGGVAAWPYTSAANETHVAVLDTVPDVREGAGTYPEDVTNLHGLGIASWIKALACPDNLATCPVKVDTYLALDLVTNVLTAPESVMHDTAHGGNFGYHTTLAQKTVEAMLDWKVLRPATRQVINMSVGGEPNIDGLSLSNPVWDSVRTALEFASCFGAFVSAAAGNHPGGIADYYLPGPTIPGAAEKVAAPTVIPGTTLSCPGAVANQPLVTMAAFGVDEEDQPIGLTRVKGLSPQGAYAQQIPINSQYLAAGATERAFDSYSMTGTSMAAATISAAAATVWALDTEGALPSSLSLREHLRATAFDFRKLYAEFWLGSGNATPPPAPMAKRISVCAAVDGLANVSVACPAETAIPTAARDLLRECFVEVSSAPDAGVEFERIEAQPDESWVQIDASAECGSGVTLDVLLPSGVPQDLDGYIQHLVDAHDADPEDILLCPFDNTFNGNVGEYDYPQPRLPDPGGGDLAFDEVFDDLYVVANPSFTNGLPAGSTARMNVTLYLYRFRVLTKRISLDFSITVGHNYFVTGLTNTPDNSTSGKLVGTLYGTGGVQRALDESVFIYDDAP